ncbi:MAG: thymidine phosphorylase [Deltaproteobacteria bacterium]|nr:thymidine phosphorylase [Deltaproteobacteria bacterium]
MRAYDIIKKKRDGNPLTADEIAFFVKGAASGDMPDYQISSLLMAVYFQGMTRNEITALTREMLYSGRILDLSFIKDKKIDKHSTGGVGDKLTLTSAPLAAALGVSVPMIAGRGLGHTGGTIDKLESIPGFRTNLTLEKFTQQINNIGISIIGQTKEIAPADAKLYALRDVTATVESIPLIASSIMSKKLAEGIDGLVLDIKVGSGAFMKDLKKARKLARTMVEIGKNMGKEIVAVLTDMDQPLGMAVGNNLELMEAVDVLKGNGPQDVIDLTIELGAWMLVLGKKASNLKHGRKKIKNAIKDGSGLKKFKEMIAYQGGNTDFIDNPFPDRSIRGQALFKQAKYKDTFVTKKNGFISNIDAESIGLAAMCIGAGRTKKDEDIDLCAGIILDKKVGEPVKKGDLLATIYFNDVSKKIPAIKYLEKAFLFCKNRPKKRPLIIEVIQ